MSPPHVPALPPLPPRSPRAPAMGKTLCQVRACASSQPNLHAISPSACTHRSIRTDSTGLLLRSRTTDVARHSPPRTKGHLGHNESQDVVFVRVALPCLHCHRSEEWA